MKATAIKSLYEFTQILLAIQKYTSAEDIFLLAIDDAYMGKIHTINSRLRLFFPPSTTPKELVPYKYSRDIISNAFARKGKVCKNPMDKIQNAPPKPLKTAIERAVAKCLPEISPLLAKAVHEAMLEQLVDFMMGPSHEVSKPKHTK